MPGPKESPVTPRPYRLSQLELEGLTVAGYSVAGEEAVILVPELDCVFDIGKCPREALAMNHLLLSHGHMDHVAGLPYYFAQRNFQGVTGGVALVPRNLVEPLEELMQAWGRVEGCVHPHEFVGMAGGDEYEIRRGLFARAFPTKHIPGSIGFSVVEVRQKLKDEYVGLSGPEIVKLKGDGVEITRRVELSHVSYLGDTARANYSSIPHVANARVLLLECTFFDDDHVSRARAGKHLHVTDLGEVLEGMNNEHVVIVHVTRRTNMAEARRLVKKHVPKDILPRVKFLMSRKYVPEEE